MADTVNAEAKKKLIEIVKLARGSMSQRAFGKLLGVSATAVQLWEKGQSIPDTENLAQIAVRAGFTMEELLAHLEGKPMREPVDTNDLLKKIQCMPISELAVIGRAVMDRLAAVAESSGKYS
ncbi:MULTISPECIES: helix-turn-helix transcriptional regulator [unclassified Microcoleus]|uniref:helix-turn-helix transcriptional regulator n=1 Tax=unclassified Microcoleus TaxID=2642155 RepID=UPI002FD59D59